MAPAYGKACLPCRPDRSAARRGLARTWTMATRKWRADPGTPCPTPPAAQQPVCFCRRSLTALLESPARLWRLITGKPAYDDRRTAAQPGAASPDRALWLRIIGAPSLVLPDPRRPPRSRRLYRAARWNAGGG